MGIGVRYEHVGVELLQPPVHERIGRQAGFDGEDVLREVAVAVRYPVESSPGSQGREPGRPDVGGDEAGHRVGLEGDLQQVPGVQSQDGPSVRLDIADGAQAGLQGFGGFESGRQDDVVHLPHAAEPLVDVRNLDRQHETNRRPAGGRHLAVHRPLDLGLQPEQALFGRLQFLLQLIHPARMNEIPGAHHPDALQLGPLVQVLQVQVLAGRSRVMGMEMQIGVEGQGIPPFVEPSRIPCAARARFRVLPALPHLLERWGNTRVRARSLYGPGEVVRAMRAGGQEAGDSAASRGSRTCPLSRFRTVDRTESPSSRI